MTKKNTHTHTHIFLSNIHFSPARLWRIRLKRHFTHHWHCRCLINIMVASILMLLMNYFPIKSFANSFTLIEWCEAILFDWRIESSYLFQNGIYNFWAKQPFVFDPFSITLNDTGVLLQEKGIEIHEIEGDVFFLFPIFFVVVFIERTKLK